MYTQRNRPLPKVHAALSSTPPPLGHRLYQLIQCNVLCKHHQLIYRLWFFLIWTRKEICDCQLPYIPTPPPPSPAQKNKNKIKINIVYLDLSGSRTNKIIYMKKNTKIIFTIMADSGGTKMGSHRRRRVRLYIGFWIRVYTTITDIISHYN